MFAYVDPTTNEVITVTDAVPPTWAYPADHPDEELAGRTVSGFNLLDDDDLAAAGWVELVEDQPAYNDKTHRLVPGDVTVEDNRAVRHWTVEKLPPAPPLTPEQQARAADRARLVELRTRGWSKLTPPEKDEAMRLIFDRATL